MNPRTTAPWLPMLLVALLAACQAPRAGHNASVPCSQPGWGRVLSPRETQMTVRAVEASAAPTRPESHLGKPGWGRR